MTVYELNQAGYASLPEMTDEQKESARKKIEDFLADHSYNDTDYLMLLNNDLHYYTVFVWKYQGIKKFIDELMDIVEDLGKIKSIEVNDNDAVEFWITGEEGTNMYVLFNYNQGVVEI